MISRRYAVTAGLVMGVAVLAVGWLWGDRIVNCLQALWAMYGSPRAIRTFVAGFGAWAPLIFIGLQAFQVVLSPIPGEATGVLGGYLFGTWPGLLYSTVGLTLGSALAFGLSRWLGLRLVRRIIPTAVYEKLSVVVRPQGISVTFILFIIPGFPKDYLSYLLGLTPISWGAFLFVSILGRIPGTWLLSAQGGAASKNQYGLFLALVVVVVALAVLSSLQSGRILQWVRRLPGSSLSDSRYH